MTIGSDDDLRIDRQAFVAWDSAMISKVLNRVNMIRLALEFRLADLVNASPSPPPPPVSETNGHGANPAIADARTTPREILRRREVARMVGLDVSTLWRLTRAGRFPKPIKLGTRSVGYRASEIEAWLAQRTAERDGDVQAGWRGRQRQRPASHSEAGGGAGKLI